MRDRFEDTKAEWLEARAAEYFERLFGRDAVFRSLRYPDPDQPPGRAEAEVDLLVRWGRFLLIVEAKARQFRLKGQLGDVGRLRDDLRVNVDQAFSQALRVRRHLELNTPAVFRDAATNGTVAVDRSQMDGVYLVTVSLHFLGGAARRLSKLRALGLLTAGEYPWAISISELDLITRVAEGPDILLHYQERRRQIEQREEFPLNDDLDLFAVYLVLLCHKSEVATGG